MTDLRDYDDWHRHYDDPDSSLSWRLRRVQAALLWSRSTDGSDRNDEVRARLADAGFTELDYATSGGGDDETAVGVVRYDGPPVTWRPGQPLFSFVS